METLSTSACFGGTQTVHRHASEATGTDMTFGLFHPGGDAPVPVLIYLSGLTCTHENAMVKAGAQAWAAEVGMAVAFPDTSPRGEGVADDDAYDLGQGAGFYVNATEAPWAQHYRMWDYVMRDLPAALAALGCDLDRQAITGHSMGGHGALTIAAAHPGRFASVSAFAPIAHPSESEWGRKQLGAYLGEGADWALHDATLQMRTGALPGPLLVDQGGADQFLDLLKPEALWEAAATARADAILRMQPGYDHSYFFVASFMADHVAFHAEALGLA
ncbi:MAG: S-formylglutathione hydrolase [Shimia sp.]